MDIKTTEYELIHYVKLLPCKKWIFVSAWRARHYKSPSTEQILVDVF